MEAASVVTPSVLFAAANCLVYNPYCNQSINRDSPSGLIEAYFPGYTKLTRLQRFIFWEYVNQRKVMGSRSLAVHMILGPNQSKPFVRKYGDGTEQVFYGTTDDVEAAYAVGAGGGCEFEWAAD